MVKKSRLALLMMLYSIQALLDSGNAEKAKEVIVKIIAEAERS